MKHYFPERLGQKCGHALYTGVHYPQQNMVIILQCLIDSFKVQKEKFSSTGKTNKFIIIVGDFNILHN